MDQAVFDKTLADELAKGTDRRVAEGRAKSAGVRAYRASHPEAAAEHESRAPRAAAAGNGEAAASAPAAAAAAAGPLAVGAPAGDGPGLRAAPPAGPSAGT